MKVWVIRHGQSLSNQLHIHSGWADVPLTDLGRRQAEAAGRYLRQYRFDRVYASDLQRAFETARLALPDCEIVPEPLLREINLGAINGRVQAECLAEYGQLYLDQKSKHDFRPFGGEDHALFTARVAAFRRKLESETAQQVAVFAHEGVLMILLQLIVGQPSYALNVLCDNCAVAMFDYTDGVWRLGGWNLAYAGYDGCPWAVREEETT